MNLIKQIWTEQDIVEFRKYLYSFSKGENKALWEQRIVNTKIKCLAVPSEEIKNIITKISKGNFISFIDFWPWENHSETVIIGNLICKIKDFKLFSEYLKNFANKIDNWASCDSLKFNINRKNEEEFFKLSNNLILSKKPFVKRVGLLILFKLLKNINFLPKIFEILNKFETEEEYYVNMMLAWIICECFIKYKEQTLNFLQQKNSLSKFVINKAISKCRDSKRISVEDKNMLLKYKV